MIFKLIDYNLPILPGFRLATKEDVENNMTKVMDVILNEWAIVELEDGSVSGNQLKKNCQSSKDTRLLCFLSRVQVSSCKSSPSE